MGNSTGTVRSLGTRRCRLCFPAGIRFSRVRLQLHHHPQPLHARTVEGRQSSFFPDEAPPPSSPAGAVTYLDQTARTGRAAAEVTNFSVPIRVQYHLYSQYKYYIIYIYTVIRIYIYYIIIILYSNSRIAVVVAIVQRTNPVVVVVVAAGRLSGVHQLYIYTHTHTPTDGRGFSVVDDAGLCVCDRLRRFYI